MDSIDTFVAAHLPPRALWPRFEWIGRPPPQLGATLNAAGELLDTAVADGNAERPAIWFDGEVWSYGRLQEEVNRIANVLVGELGLRRGQRVVLRGLNRPTLAAAWLATVKAGGVAVTTMPMLRARELAEIVTRTRADLVLVDARKAGEELSLAIERSAHKPRHVLLYDDPAAGDSLEARARRAPRDFRAAPTAPDDPALIAFTSGTTGRAKATVHFHRDVLAVCDLFPPHALQSRPDDVFCGTPSLAFTYGLGGLLLFPLRARACVALTERSEDLLAVAAQARATVMFSSPAMYRLQAPLWASYGLGSMRTCVSAGETLPAGVYDRWLAKTGLRIIDGIGSTELLHIFISSPAPETRAGATGRVVPGYQAAVLDEEFRTVPPGTVGRLAVRGPTGCRYMLDPDSGAAGPSTRDTLDNQAVYVQHGWNITGDTYVVDEEGYFHFHARADDLIVSRGLNVSAAEVENVLLEYPGVRECAVVAYRDARSGDVLPKAYVVRAAGTAPLTAAELARHVRHELADFKCPRQFEFVESLPRTDTGKVQRSTLRRTGDSTMAVATRGD